MGKSPRLRAALNRGWFRRGPDDRRHQLTTEERRRGGYRAWHRTMADLRLNLNLPLPSAEVRAAAEDLLAARRRQLQATRKELGL